jgi:thiol-disulfide isomerase/thioredoxin
MDFQAKARQGLSYSAFLEQYGTDEHKRRWAAVHEQVRLTDAQRQLLSGFVREMHVFVLAGAWCGDCVNQCPILDCFARATSKIHLHFFDRDAHPDLHSLMSICGAARVPSVLFLSEDGFICGHYGDRTLAKYREMASALSGSACPSGIVAPGQSLLDQVTQEWLNEFERIQWMLRLSGRLRQMHGD